MSGLNKGGAADVEKSLYLTDRLDDPLCGSPL